MWHKKTAHVPIRDREEQLSFVSLSIIDGIAEARLKRGKVNALNELVIDETAGCLQSLAADPDIRALILTGDGSFFSFGFDIPEFLSHSKVVLEISQEIHRPVHISVHLSKTCRGCIERPCSCGRMHACAGL